MVSSPLVGVVSIYIVGVFFTTKRVEMNRKK